MNKSDTLATSIERKKILIYGAVARQDLPETEPAKLRWHAGIKPARDRFLSAIGSTGLLDYRNYDLPYATNRGDMAIGEAVRNQFRHAVSNCDFANVNWGELDKLDAEEISRCFDLVVIAGSGYFHYAADGALAGRIAKDLQFWEKISTPIVLYGAGVNRLLPLYSQSGAISLRADDESLLRRILQRMSLVGVRSADSRDVLAPYVTQPIRLVCDPALFLQPYRPQGFQRAVSGNFLPPRIGINFAFHGPLSNGILQRNFNKYVYLLRNLHEETGCSFHYFIHNHSEWIIPQLLRDKGLPVENVAGDPYELAQHYAKMNIHVGGMLHSCILASGAGTPCILLAYDAKHFGFARLLGIESQCHLAAALDADAVLSSVRSLLGDEAGARRDLNLRLAMLWQEQLQFLHDCSALLQPR